LTLVVAEMEKSTFLRLLPMTDQDKYVSISPIDPNDPKLYWILRDADFKVWESANSSVLLLFGGPPGCDMTGVSSLIARQEVSRRQDGAVFYFSCSMEGSDVSTTFTYSVLRHILNGSNPCQAKLITETFLRTLLLKIIQRNRSRFKDVRFPVITLEEILRAEAGGLLEALTEAVVEIRTIGDMPIIIDGIDNVGLHGAQFLHRFCSLTTANPKPKVLVTCRPDPRIQKIVDGMPCIVYDKERQEHKDSLEWLWTHEKYKKWSSSEGSSILYIEGKPGSGKSTLAKHFRENLAAKEPNASSSIIANYFYTHRGTTLEPTHENMLRSVLYSILKQDETFFIHFQSEFRKFRPTNDSKWPYTSLQQILSSLAYHPFTKHLYLVLDAMDESEETDRSKIIDLLCRLCAESQSCIIKVFLASRPVPQIKNRVKASCYVIRLQDENEKDISNFARSFLGPDLNLPPEIIRQATEYIVKKAQGVFVWVHLVKQKLLKYSETGCTEKRIFNYLKCLPTGLEEFYRTMLNELEERDEPEDFEDGLRMFRLVLFANRPLRLAELHHALAIPDDPNAEFSPSDDSFEEDLIHGIDNRVIHCGGNFLEIKGLDEDSSVQVMHQTVREFFLKVNGPVATSRFKMNEDDAHCRISITCIRYLMLCVARRTSENEPQNVESWQPAHFEKYSDHLHQRPFIDFSLSHFQQHKKDRTVHPQTHNGCNQCVNDGRLVSQLKEQLTNNPASLLLKGWVNSYLDITTEEQELLAKDFRNTLLHTVTRMRHSRVVEALLTAGADKEDCLLDKTPLLVSAEIGDIATAGVLLRKGACTEAKDDKEQTPLLLAATKGHDAMISLLVDGGANKEAKDKYGQTALHHAASNGHDTTVQLLVKTLGVDKEVKDGNEWTALHHAASNGHNTTLRILVETLSVDKEATDRKGRTALHHAASNGHDTTLRILIETLSVD
ncbi:hypothetical protein BDD12DRAFT_649380, partial [Trichophaea hybrida]